LGFVLDFFSCGSSVFSSRSAQCTEVHGDRCKDHRTGNRALLRQFVETMNTLLKMPRALERILVKLEAEQVVINLGGGIGIGDTAFRRRERNGASTAFPIALALMFVACLGTAAFFLHHHDEILAIAALGLAAILGLQLFFGGEQEVKLRSWSHQCPPSTIAQE